ncbi:MAG: glucose-6-phosphate isomerase [Candidatus Eisenbacteria bacterium]|nr:glucose-6-phosphate isomerase [Candidatus Eisenbacteria bacterium]
MSALEGQGSSSSSHASGSPSSSSRAPGSPSSSSVTWDDFRGRVIDLPDLGVRLDASRMRISDADLEALHAPLAQALARMHELERGAIANPDEGRPVGHYWLRNPDLAPDPAVPGAIRESWERMAGFAARTIAASRVPMSAAAEAVRDPLGPPARFRHFLLIGIGGSALGPQLLADVFAKADLPLAPHFLDNTDPDGIARLLAELGPDLAETLVIVVSKSGGTKETRNGMLEIDAALRRMGRSLGPQAVAITMEGSELDAYAREHGFLDVFPLWEWVGGRFSITSPVGLLPAALMGIDIRGFLEGARAMDAVTRMSETHAGGAQPSGMPVGETRANPAALLAAAWHIAGEGRGSRDMVVLPYRDRLLLLGRYLQQLVMESLGKEKDLRGQEVHQGIVVYGNKGSTDQHAFVQQLREGPDNFFVTFLHARKGSPTARRTPPIEVEPEVRSGDYLLGFLLGTREALAEKGRRSLTITLPDISERSLGALIALFERAVGLYADLAGINAYDQPGVEAGKRAARRALDVQKRVLAQLAKESETLSAPQLAARMDPPADPETVFHLLEHLASDGRIRAIAGETWYATRFAAR